MKYEWLEIEAYLSWENLVLSVENILSNYGTEYVINFVQVLIKTISIPV
jgi:hypothetical protein